MPTPAAYDAAFKRHSNELDRFSNRLTEVERASMNAHDRRTTHEVSLPTAGVVAGSRLFCAGEPGLAPGTVLPPGQYGRRQLGKPILTLQETQGEGLREGFDLGPLADQVLDLSKPRRLSVVHPRRAVGVLVELVWETVRLREFPHRPSRLDCSFFWTDEQAARDWLARRTWPSCLYEVEVIECRCVFIADLTKLEFTGDGTVAAMMDQARRYWSEPGETSANPEVLLEGVVHVVGSV